ncbi:MAG: hypothetical protein FWC47_02630 [Oscillospiraceae bacterium]|nr:hypothetical protein [Oscillospiraceae bacterium]
MTKNFKIACITVTLLLLFSSVTAIAYNTLIINNADNEIIKILDKSPGVNIEKVVYYNKEETEFIKNGGSIKDLKPEKIMIFDENGNIVELQPEIKYDDIIK